MSISDCERDALRRFRDLLVREFGATEVRLFGSKARGHDTPASDMDVAVILPATSPELESRMDDVAFEINLEHDCLITPLYFSEEEIATGPMAESPIYKSILREGVPV